MVAHATSVSGPGVGRCADAHLWREKWVDINEPEVDRAADELVVWCGVVVRLSVRKGRAFASGRNLVSVSGDASNNVARIVFHRERSRVRG